MKKLEAWIMILVFCTIMWGCASLPILRYKEAGERARTELIGMSKADLLCCAGVPVRSEQIEGREFLVYARSEFKGSTYKGSGNVRSYYHEVIFVLRGGVIEKVMYRGDRGLISGFAGCGKIVEPCLKENK